MGYMNGIVQWSVKYLWEEVTINKWSFEKIKFYLFFWIHTLSSQPTPMAQHWCYEVYLQLRVSEITALTWISWLNLKELVIHLVKRTGLRVCSVSKEALVTWKMTIHVLENCIPCCITFLNLSRKSCSVATFWWVWMVNIPVCVQRKAFVSRNEATGKGVNLTSVATEQSSGLVVLDTNRWWDWIRYHTPNA